MYIVLYFYNWSNFDEILQLCIVFCPEKCTKLENVKRFITKLFKNKKYRELFVLMIKTINLKNNVLVL